MEGSLADKLYSESLQLSKIQLDVTSSANSKLSVLVGNVIVILYFLDSISKYSYHRT